jgi:hypothetical protein
MRALRFLTWLDVKRLIRKNTLNGAKFLDCINSISCFSDALEIGIPNIDCRDQAKDILANWFKDWYQKAENVIRLDLGNAALPVEIYENESASINVASAVHPFWDEIVYVGNGEGREW